MIGIAVGASRNAIQETGTLEREKRSALRATIIPWGHPSMLQPSPGEGYGKPTSLIAMLPAAAGVRRGHISPPDRHHEVGAEAAAKELFLPLHDDGGAPTS